MSSPEYDSIWLQLCSELRIKLPEDHYTQWVENFSIVKVAKNKIVIGCYDETIKSFFADNYEIEIANAANIACGSLVTIKYTRIKQPANSVDAEGFGNDVRTKISVKNLIAAVVCVIFAFVLLVLGVNFVKNFNFKESFYTVSSRKVYEPFRIIQISDLHETSFGNNNENLIKRIKKLNPDLIVFTGDIVESSSFNESTRALLKACADLTASYYVYGNNEEEAAFDSTMTLDDLDKKFGSETKLLSSDKELKKAIESTGVKVLMNEYVTVDIKGNKVDIFGCLTANPSAFWNYAGVNFNKYANENTGNFKLFITHEPYVFTELPDENYGDAALAGHTHGGIIKVPVLGALYEKSYGLFPERKGYVVKGKTTVNHTQLIIDSGLSNKGIVRIGNQPELVIVDVNGH